MSAFQKTVSKTVREYGIDIIGTVQFYGLLSDEGAFRDEKPAMKNIVRVLNGSPEMKNLITNGRISTLSVSEVRSAVTSFSDRCGFDKSLVSRSIVSILKGAGLLPVSFSLGEMPHQPDRLRDTDYPVNPQPRSQPNVQSQDRNNGSYDYTPGVRYHYPSTPLFFDIDTDWLKKAWSIIWKVGLAALGVFILIKLWWLFVIIVFLIIYLFVK